MSSRRYPTAELYEERERDFYRNGGRSERNYEELDVELRRGSDPRRSAPDFFREDYGRSSQAGPLVARQRDEEFSRGPRHARTFDDDARSTRSSRPGGGASVREVERDDITIRTRDGPERRRPREVDSEETDIVIRRRDQSRPRTGEFREVERERDDIVFRRGDGPPSGRGRQFDERDDVRFRGRGGDEEIDIRHSDTRRNGRAVSTERETIRFQERDGRFELTDRETNTHRGGRSQSRERSSITIKGRERSLPPPSRGRGELVAREREEFIVRRPRDISPPENPREIIKEEIVIRRKEERAPTPSPSPSPPPPPAPPALEPEIRPPIIQEIITHHRHIDHGVVRARSPTPPPPSPPTPPPQARNETIEIEINRREQSRGRVRDTEEDLEIDINLKRDRSRGDELQVKPRRRDMWTEVTKDLVLREAIESMGYSWEESDEHFYVMEYLRYEDVLQLVEISDRIRDKRSRRSRDIEIERKEYRDSRGGYDDRFYEHDISFDSRRGSRYR